MSEPSVEPQRGGGVATVALFAFAAVVLGLLGTLPLFLGPAVGVLGVVGSAVLRSRRPRAEWTVSLAPALVAVLVLTAAAPVGPSTELFAGLTGLAFLLWVADDPDRSAGGGRRAVPTIGIAALGVGLTWVIALAAAGRVSGVGLAGGVLAVALIVLAVLFTRLPEFGLGPSRSD